MTQDYKKKTVIECSEIICNALTKTLDPQLSDLMLAVIRVYDLAKVTQIIQAQCDKAVEEYKKHNPPVGWLPITDEQKDGELWLLSGPRGGGIFDWDYAYWSSNRGCFENKAYELLPFIETHYLPIDQIPLPEKEI